MKKVSTSFDENKHAKSSSSKGVPNKRSSELVFVTQKLYNVLHQPNLENNTLNKIARFDASITQTFMHRRLDFVGTGPIPAPTSVP